MAEVPVTNKKIQSIARNKTVILLFLQFLCASQCQYQNCTCRHFAEKFRKNIYRKYHVREPRDVTNNFCQKIKHYKDKSRHSRLMYGSDKESNHSL